MSALSVFLRKNFRKMRILWIALFCFIMAALGWTAIYVSQIGTVVPLFARGHELHVCRDCGVNRVDRSLQVLDWTSERTSLKATLTSKFLDGKRSSPCKHQALAFVYLQRKAIHLRDGFASRQLLSGNVTNHHFLNDELFVQELKKAADAQKMFRAESFARLP